MLKMTPETSPFDAAISELEARIQKLQGTLETLKLLRSGAEGTIPGSASMTPRPGDAEVQHDSFFGMTIADATRKYLNMAKHTKSTAEIAEALETGGLKHASKNFQTTLRATLGQKEEFLRVNGEWGLAEWYPGLGRGKKAKAEKPKKARKVRANAKKTASKAAKAAGPILAESGVQTGPQARVEEYLAAHPDATAREIADALGLRIQTVGLILGKLKGKAAA